MFILKHTWTIYEKWPCVPFNTFFKRVSIIRTKKKLVKLEMKGKQASTLPSALKLWDAVQFLSHVEHTDPSWEELAVLGGRPGSRGSTCCWPTTPGLLGIRCCSCFLLRGQGWRVVWHGNYLLPSSVGPFVNINLCPSTLFGGRTLKTTWDTLFMGIPGFSSIPVPW